MTVEDAGGVSHQYVGYYTSLIRAKRDARKWVISVSGEKLVGVRPAKETSLRRSLALAGLAFATCGVTIIAAIIFGLSLGGAL